METFDLAVIGAGPAGYPAAIRAAQLGARVALIEKEALGGCCLNWGCIPSKSLLASASLFSRVRSAEALGVRVENPSLDYGAAIERKNQIVRQLQKGIGQLLKANKVTVFEGSAAYQERNRLRVTAANSDESFEISCRKSIIATGLQPTSGSFRKHPGILDCRSFFQMSRLPSRVLILGGGIVGWEFASLLGQLGVEVILGERGRGSLDFVDPDVRREWLRSLEKAQGIRVIQALKIEEVSPGDERVRVSIEGVEVDVDYLIDTTNLEPAADLKLEQAGVEVNDDGFVQVDDYQQSCASTVYAVGDITGPPFLAHRATAEGLVAAENAVGGNRRRESLVPICIYTEPEIGIVGLTEEEARRRKVEIKVDKFKMGALGRALTLAEPLGFVKWIVDPGTQQLLGAQAVGPRATELISEATLAIRGEFTAAELVRTVHAHPTLSEAWFEAAQGTLGFPIHSVPRPNK